MGKSADGAVPDRTPPVWERAFLSALARLGVVGHACEAAGVARSTAYAHRSADDSFAQAWREAQQLAADRLEAEAFRRAIEGDRQPVLHNGRPVFVWHDPEDEIVPEGTPGATRRVLTKVVRSDLLLIFTLKALRPERFRDRYDPRAKGPDDRDIDKEIENLARELDRRHRDLETRAKEAEARASAAEKELAALRSADQVPPVRTPAQVSP